MFSDVLGNFFSFKSAEFLHVASDSLGKHCPAFFLPVSPCFARKNICNKTVGNLCIFFVTIANRRNQLSSLLSKIVGVGNSN